MMASEESILFAKHIKEVLGDDIVLTPVVFMPKDGGNETYTCLGTVYNGKKFRVVIEDVELDES